MEILAPVLLLLVGLAFFVSLRARRGHTRGGITDRPAAPGAASGSAQDADGAEDRDAFEAQTDGTGTR